MKRLDRHVEIVFRHDELEIDVSHELMQPENFDPAVGKGGDGVLGQRRGVEIAADHRHDRDLTRGDAGGGIFLLKLRSGALGRLQRPGEIMGDGVGVRRLGDDAHRMALQDLQD